MYSVWILINVSMYLYSYPSTHGISGLAAGCAWEQFEVRLKMIIEWTQRYTPRPWSREFGDARRGRNRAGLGHTLGGWDRASLEMRLKAVIERLWRYTRRMWWSEFGNTLGGRNQASWKMHLQAVIERVWRYTWRPWSSEIGWVLGGGRWTARWVLRLYSSVS